MTQSRSLSISRCLRNASLIRRLIRFLLTAFRSIFFATIRPIRAWLKSTGFTYNRSERLSNTIRLRSTARNSSAFRSLHCLGSVQICLVAKKYSPDSGPGLIYYDYTLSLVRPFARRARIIALPPRVFMRIRNPWVRFLLMTDGW